MRNLTKIYLPDGNGGLATYLPLVELAEVLRVTPGTISMWIRAGSVRATPKLRGRRNASVEDALRLRLLTVKESQELGLDRIPQDVRLINQVDRDLRQSRTVPAEHHREEWDSYDDQFLIDGYVRGDRFEDMARELGRTFAATMDRIVRLRVAGDLPEIERVVVDWLDTALQVLLPEESARLIMELEQRSMNRPCELINAQSVVVGDDDVMTVVYDMEPYEHEGLAPMHERRWAVYVNEVHAGSGIVSTRFERTDGWQDAAGLSGSGRGSG